MSFFLILGANKSGTSVATAIANTHPNVFCLYEVDFTKSATHGRNRDLVSYLPETAPLFDGPIEAIGDCLNAVAASLAKRGHSFTHFGVKVVGFRPDIYTRLRLPVLYTVRDIRTWGAKGRVITDVIGTGSDRNAAPVLARYVGSYIMTFLYPQVSRIRLEDLFEDHAAMPKAVAAFLRLDVAPFTEWWTKSDWRLQEPKNYSRWFDGHSSAFLPPVFSDTQAVVTSHPFWEKILPVFDKYYERADQTFDSAEVSADLELVREALSMTMSVDEAYSSFRSVKVATIEYRAEGKSVVRVREGIEKTPGGIIKPMDV